MTSPLIFFFFLVLITLIMISPFSKFVYPAAERSQRAWNIQPQPDIPPTDDVDLAQARRRQSMGRERQGRFVHVWYVVIYKVTDFVIYKVTMWSLTLWAVMHAVHWTALNLMASKTMCHHCPWQVQILCYKKLEYFTEMKCMLSAWFYMLYKWGSVIKVYPWRLQLLVVHLPWQCNLHWGAPNYI